MSKTFTEILIENIDGELPSKKSKWKTKVKTYWKGLTARHNAFLNKPEEKKKKHIPPHISAGKLRPAEKHKKVRLKYVNPIIKGMD